MKSIKLSLFVIALCATSALAVTKDQLRHRFEQRYPQIRELKSKGIIGETYQGYLEAVKGNSADVDKLVSDDNADRRELYQAIAKDEGVDPSLVAERNARRNFDRARPGEYLKGQDGQWHRK